MLLRCGTDKGDARKGGRAGRNAAGGGGGGGSGAQQRGANGLAGGSAAWLAPEATAAPGVAFGFVRVSPTIVAAAGHACLAPFLQLQLQCAPGEQVSLRPLPPTLARPSTPAPRAMLCPIVGRGGRGEATEAELGAFGLWLRGAAGAAGEGAAVPLAHGALVPTGARWARIELAAAVDESEAEAEAEGAEVWAGGNAPWAAGAAGASAGADQGADYAAPCWLSEEHTQLRAGVAMRFNPSSPRRAAPLPDGATALQLPPTPELPPPTHDRISSSSGQTSQHHHLNHHHRTSSGATNDTNGDSRTSAAPSPLPPPLPPLPPLPPPPLLPRRRTARAGRRLNN